MIPGLFTCNQRHVLQTREVKQSASEVDLEQQQQHGQHDESFVQLIKILINIRICKKYERGRFVFRFHN